MTDHKMKEFPITDERQTDRVEFVEYESDQNDASIESTIDPKLEKKLVRRIDMRLLPVTAFVYLLCYLDRGNIGNAKILNSNTNDDLLQTNHMTNTQYIIALMVFLVAYSIFEAPSNLVLKALSPSKWIGFLVITFGAFCTGIAGTHNFAGTTALRFFLGAAEAGVFPGLVYYMSLWYKPQERALRIAAFLCSATLAGAFGGALAFGVGHINGAGGLNGWRWLFIIEGVPTVIVGVFIFFFLPDYPETSSWLTAEEKALQGQRLGSFTRSNREKPNWADAKEGLKTWTLYVHYFIYLCEGVSIGSLALFSPTIVAGLGYTSLNAQLFTVPPYVVAYVFTLAAAFVSDRYQQRGAIAGCCCLLAGVAFAVSAGLDGTQYTARYAMLVLATTGAFGSLPALNAWVGDNVRSSTAASISIALNIAVSGPGQIIGVWIYRAQDKPFYRLGHAVNAGAMLLASILSFGLMFHYKSLNRKMAGTNERRYIA